MQLLCYKKKKVKKTKKASKPSPVLEKLKRGTKEVLVESQVSEQKKGLLAVLKNILHEGINISLKNKKEYGHFINRRGQIGENKTMAAMNIAVNGFRGITATGLKTFSYLQHFLESLDIDLTYKNTTNAAGKIEFHEVEHDGILTFLDEDVLVLNVIQSKTSQLRYLEDASQEERRQAAISHAVEALKQLFKDFITFKQIFLDINMNKIRFQYYAALSDVSYEDWPEDCPTEHILFKEDIDDVNKMKLKMGVPDTPPANISSAVLELNKIIGARYLGVASLIKLKNPSEGFSKQATVMKKIRSDYEKKEEKVMMMGPEQQAIFQSGVKNYSNFGGHGSGKTILLQANIKREAERMVDDSESQYLLILCV